MSFEVIDGCTLEVFGESAWSSDPSTLFDGAPPLSLDYLSTDIEYTKQPPANQNDWRSPHPSPESSDGSPIWSPSSLSSDDHSPVSILDTPLSPLNSFPAMNIGIFQPQSGLEDPLVPRPSPSPFAKYSPFRKDLSDFDAPSPVTVNPAELELSPSVDMDVDVDENEAEDEEDDDEDEDEDDPPIIAPPCPSIIRRCIQRLRPEPDYRVARRARAARRSTSPDVESPAPHTWSPPSPLSSSSSSSTSPHLHTCGLQYIDDGEMKTCTHTTTDREPILHRSTCPAKRRRRSPTDEDSEPYIPGSKMRKKSRGNSSTDKEKELFVCNLTSVVNGKEVTCTSTFTRNFDLERHRRLSRRHNADQMGECRFCGRVLSLRKDSMGRHHKDACVVLRDMRKHKALGRNVVPLRMVDKQARWVLGDVLERHWVEEFGEWHPIAGAQ